MNWEKKREHTVNLVRTSLFHRIIYRLPMAPRLEAGDESSEYWGYYINVNNLYIFLSPCPLSMFTFLFLQRISWKGCRNSIFVGLSVCNSQSSRMMLALLFGLMLRPVTMSSQDPVQEFLGNRLSSSLLGGNFCRVNQCFPLILQMIVTHY